MVSVYALYYPRGLMNVRLLRSIRFCVRIANEILMYFRSTKKNMSDLSLSDSLDSDVEGNGLSIMDVVAQEDEMLERVELLESCSHLREYMDRFLTKREADIIRMRYGLEGGKPSSQREVALRCGISRSYVSRRH